MSAQTVTLPKESKGVLVPTNNTIAVANGMLYDYYSIKLGERTGPFVALTKLTERVLEGYVTYSNRLYHITKKDYIRRRLNVSNPYTPVSSNTDSGDGIGITAAANTTEHVVEACADQNQSRLDECVDAEICKAADLAWQEQIESLQYLDD